MKKVYLIHGWGGTGEGGWFDWLKEKLKESNIMVDSLEMPNTDKPKIEEWVGYLNNTVKEIDEETYFVGHSIGGQAILRFLEKLPEGIKIGGCVFVAGFFNLKEETYEFEADREIAKPWIETPINLEKVKDHTNNFLAIFSDNDPYVPLSEVEKFKKELDAKTIIKNNEEHFNKTMEIPEILEFIK